MAGYGEKLDGFYRRLGDRGVLFALFAAGVFVHTVFALRMTAPSIYPNEFETAALSGFFAGFGHSGGFSDAPFGWLTAILYTPFYFLIKNPFARYRSMLILNGVIAALIPLFTYKITAALGLKKAWQRWLCAAVTGISVSAFAYTKFIWSETVCAVYPFLLFWLFIKTTEVKNRFVKILFSVLAAFLCGFAPAAHPRLWILTIVFILTVIFAKFILRVKSVSFMGFIPFLVFFLVLQTALSEYLRFNVTDGLSALGLFKAAGFDSPRFFRALCSHLYYFAVSTWGLGVLGFCLCFSVIASACTRGIYNAKLYPSSNLKRSRRHMFRTQTAKPDLPSKHFAAFAFFAAIYSALMILASAYRGPSGIISQSAYLFGRYIDGAAPLVLLAALCYIFTPGIDFRKLLYSIITLGVIFALFFTFSAHELINAEQDGLESVQGFSVIRVGSAIDAPITANGLFSTVSVTFCFAALLIALVCCAERYRAHLISLCAALTAVYSCVHGALFYLPYEMRRAERENGGAYSISEYIYNSSDAPPTYVLESQRLSLALRFLNRDADINLAADYGGLPEDCFIVMLSESADLNNFGFEITVLAETNGLTLAAKGERSVAYAHSQEKD